MKDSNSNRHEAWKERQRPPAPVPAYFLQQSSTDLRRFEGHGLSISNCTEQQCAFSILMENKVAHGNATGLLQVYSGTRAVAHLLSGKKEYCSLRRTLDPKQPSINVQQNAGDCSYFETPGATFVETYALHARVNYVFYDTAACFASVDPTMLALCTNRELSDQQSKWQLLFNRVADLGEERSGLAEGIKEQAAQDILMQNCDHAGQIVKCLTHGFAHSTKELDARRAAWLEEVTLPGEPSKAARAAAAICRQLSTQLLEQ